MSLGAYDKALLDYLRSSLSFSNIYNAEDSAAFSVAAYNTGSDFHSDDESAKNVEVEFPLITFWRISNPPVEEGGNFPSRKRGLIVDSDPESGEADRVRNLPIEITYQITIWSDIRTEVDNIFRELAMYIYTDNPRILVEFQPDYSEEFVIRPIDVSSDVDIDSFTEKGRLYRTHIIIVVPDARLVFSNKSKLTKDMPIRTTLIYNEND